MSTNNSNHIARLNLATALSIRDAMGLDYEENRLTVESFNIGFDTIVSAMACPVMLEVAWACSNPDDKGRLQKHNEVKLRVQRAVASGHSMTWLDIHARDPRQTDLIRNHKRVERKGGVGDWAVVPRQTVTEALEYLKKQNKFWLWIMPELDINIFLPAKEFYEALDEFHGRGTVGAETFFNKTLKANDRGGYVLKSQPVKTSRLKVAFLQELSTRSYDFEWFWETGELVRRGE